MMKKKGSNRIRTDKILHHPWCAVADMPVKSPSEDSVTNSNNDTHNRERENNSTHLSIELFPDSGSESLLSKLIHKFSPKSVEGLRINSLDRRNSAERPKSTREELPSTKQRTVSLVERL